MTMTNAKVSTNKGFFEACKNALSSGMRSASASARDCRVIDATPESMTFRAPRLRQIW